MGKKQKNIIAGCIYRHPFNNLEHFQEILKDLLVNLEKKNMEVYLIGYMNINFLNYNSDNKIADYLDTLFDLGVMPLITKATRITDHTKTLIDHIYTNMPHKSFLSTS